MIITIFHKDGRKERKPLGYGGGLCNEATLPYERYDLPGQVTKVVTGEACLPPADVERVATNQKVG